MSVNPYVTQEYLPPPTAPTPSPPRKAAAGRVRKTNRVALTCGIIGVLIGVWIVGIPMPGGLSSYDYGRQMGRCLAYAHLCGAVGYAIGWVLRLFFSRPGTALLIVGATAAIGYGFALQRGLASRDSRAGLTSNRTEAVVSDPVRVDSAPVRWKPIDLARHQEPNRIQFGNEPISVILPPKWKEVKREPDRLIYAGSTGVAFPGSVGMMVHPKPGRVTIEAIKDSLAKSTPEFVSFIEDGELTLDGKRALFVAYRARLKGTNFREVVYIVPGQSKLYQLSVACHDPPTKSSRVTLTRVVNSLRVD